MYCRARVAPTAFSTKCGKKSEMTPIEKIVLARS
jgi:hypothetical protein